MRDTSLPLTLRIIFNVFIFWKAEVLSSHEDFTSEPVLDDSQACVMSTHIADNPRGSQARLPANTAFGSVMGAPRSQADILPQPRHVLSSSDLPTSNIDWNDEVESVEDDISDYSQDSPSESFEQRRYTPSTVPETSPDISVKHDEREDDSESTDDEIESIYSEDSNTDRISSRLWSHEEAVEGHLHSPVSTEPWAIEYTSRIKTLTEMALKSTSIPYFFALSVLRIESSEIPVMIVLSDTPENIVTASKSLETVVQDSD